MNRTLLSLTLAQNEITDVGAKELSQSIARFPLTHEEVVERRKLKSDKGFGLDSGKTPPPSRRADSKDRPGSHRSNSHLGKDKRDKSSKKKVTYSNTYSCVFVLMGSCTFSDRLLIIYSCYFRMIKPIRKHRQRVKVLKRLRSLRQVKRKGLKGEKVCLSATLLTVHINSDCYLIIVLV